MYNAKGRGFIGDAYTKIMNTFFPNTKGKVLQSDEKGFEFHIPQLIKQGNEYKISVATHSGPQSRNNWKEIEQGLKQGKESWNSLADAQALLHDARFSGDVKTMEDMRNADKEMQKGLWKNTDWKDPASVVNTVIQSSGILLKQGYDLINPKLDTFTTVDEEKDPEQNEARKRVIEHMKMRGFGQKRIRRHLLHQRK